MEAQTYAKIVFADFNQTSKHAVINVLIDDDQQRIEVEFKPKKKP